MDDEANAQTPGKRKIVESLDRDFARLHVNSCAVIEHTSSVLLYAIPPSTDVSVSASGAGRLPTIGESILRSAAVIEQTFGGITASLWDDPFEWTLREYLSTPVKVKEHLGEVEATRKRAFGSFVDDDCLLKDIAVPAGGARPLIALLSETLVRAAGYQSQALDALKILSGICSTGFII